MASSTSRGVLATALLFAGVSGVASLHAQSVAEGGIELSHRARSVQPGELVRIQAILPQNALSVTGTALDRPIRFYQAAPGVWQGLLGIDLEASPGVIPVMVGAVTAGGLTLRARYDLTVDAKTFPTRRLTVASEYVNPPPEVSDRITREAQQVSAIFKTDSDDRFWSGSFARPVPGDATSSFGQRSILNGQARSPHSGTDFRGAAGTPVKAPNTGRVVLADELYFSGNVVILDHGWGLYSYFAHLSRIDVAEGDMVATGQVVGAIGATGRVTGPHLHWTVRVNGARVDALSVLAVLSRTSLQ